MSFRNYGKILKSTQSTKLLNHLHRKKATEENLISTDAALHSKFIISLIQINK